MWHDNGEEEQPTPHIWIEVCEAAAMRVKLRGFQAGKPVRVQVQAFGSSPNETAPTCIGPENMAFAPANFHPYDTSALMGPMGVMARLIPAGAVGLSYMHLLSSTRTSISVFWYPTPQDGGTPISGFDMYRQAPATHSILTD